MRHKSKIGYVTKNINQLMKVKREINEITDIAEKLCNVIDTSAKVFGKMSVNLRRYTGKFFPRIYIDRDCFHKKLLSNFA